MKFPLFKRAVAKIAEGRQVTDAERASVRCLLKPVVDADNDNDDVLDEGDMRVLVNNDESGDHPNNSLTYAQKVELRMKRRKTNNNDVASKYVNLDVLCGTSVQCERLFSVAKTCCSYLGVLAHGDSHIHAGSTLACWPMLVSRTCCSYLGVLAPG